MAFTDLARDPRVHRQLRFLRDDYRLTAAGLGDPRLEGVEFVRLAPRRALADRRGVRALLLAARRFEQYYWGRGEIVDAARRLRGVGCDLVLANDLDCLPLALRLAAGSPVVFDAHEFASAEFEEQLRFRLLHRPLREYLCRRYLPRAAAMMTVSDGIADAYRRFGVPRPAVVWNAPDYEELEPSPTPRGDAPIRLVHHGGAQRSRGLEQMIRTMRELEGPYELHLVLVGRDTDYIRYLRGEAASDRRIRFVDPVPMLELPRFLNAFDVGVYLLRPTNFNNRHALPNKFFEFVQARLALAIGPSPEMARLLEQHDLGVVAPDFEPRSLARRLSALDRDQIAGFKRNAHAAARALSSAESRRRLRELVARALGERSAASRPATAEARP